jgi:CsoR family transcriptional regulator, copper-sensing transcriptional repressor
MKLENEEVEAKLVQRLRRIEGQIRGIESMLAEKRDCKDIVQQLSAAQAALQGFSRTFLEEYAVQCFLNQPDKPEDPRSREEALRELVNMVTRVA